MKRKIFAALLVFVLMFTSAVTAFAAAPEVAYDASYNDDTKLVTVSVYVKNAVGTESADLCLAIDPAMFEFQEADESRTGNISMIVADKSPLEEGLCTCSFVFKEACLESDLDENGNLQLATYTFKPLGERFDINDFCLWAGSFDVADQGDVADSIGVQGDKFKRDDHTRVVTVYENANNHQNSSNSSEKSSKWYVYVIAGVLAVIAIVGIALIAVKSGHDDSDEEETDGSSGGGGSDSADASQPEINTENNDNE